MVAADFSGYATKAGLKCSDGRTITSEAFKHMDGKTVPLVWQHMYNEPANVLGKALLHHREDGIYAEGFFNETARAQEAKELVKHGDVVSLSIHANQLVQKGKDVLHGMIREVSLVLSGANPGALIDNVAVVHSDGTMEPPDETEAIIYSLEEQDLIHSDESDDDDVDTLEGVEIDETESTATHSDETEAKEDTEMPEDVMHADGEEKTMAEIYETLNEDQRSLLHFMVGSALENAKSDDSANHSDDDDNNLTHTEGTTDMANVFDQDAMNTQGGGNSLSHDQLSTIMEEAKRTGSYKEAFLAHAAEYGIENIDILFPDAKALSDRPEFISRRMEWVDVVLSGTKHSPFSRIKTVVADITADEARARGYVKGNLKKEEVIKLLRRVTTPTTIYKKQKLDRDDIIDITDLDVVAWLKAEMRVMLDEEIARAILIGDGREADSEDKIDEDKLRPIATDDDMYTHKITMPSNTSPSDMVKYILRGRTNYRGSGNPVLFTRDDILTDLMLLEDKIGRRLYATEAELAAALRVSRIVVVEVMETQPNLFAILVNLQDYTVGADRGGAISMFDDFDIDYNQYKYLIETRISGALTKPKSAVAVRRDPGTLVTPLSPSFNGATNTITLPATEGVTYLVNDVAKTGDVVITESTEVEATAAAGFYFPSNINTNWTYIPNAI